MKLPMTPCHPDQTFSTKETTVTQPAYTIEEHKHRLAAWAASTAARASSLCRFNVEAGIAILEEVGFVPAFIVSQLPEPENLDSIHRDWRRNTIAAASNRNHAFTHGVAAKLINCYLKVRFVCGGDHTHRCVQTLHPPIDALLLMELARQDFGGRAREWRKLHDARWSKFDSPTYERVIKLIRESLPAGSPLWIIEQHWGGFR